MTAADEARIVALLHADVGGPVPCEIQGDVIVETAARQRLFASGFEEYVYDVVCEVQQSMHDLFIDTTWPACPLHPNHPLWFSGSSWYCQATGTVIAPLGELRTRL